MLDALRSGNDPLQVTMPTRFNMDKLITDFTIDGPQTLTEIMAEAQAQYDEETAEAQSLEDYGNTPHPADLTAPKLIVSADVGYEAMMDALRDNIDPLMVEVETECGQHIRLCSCTVRALGGVLMSIFDLLKIVRLDRQHEILAAREEDAEELPTHDWSL